MQVTVHFDGACEPQNPEGVATWGFVVYVNGREIYSDCGVVGEGQGMSNNVAEFTAMAKALEWLLENGFADAKVTVRGDSQLAVNLINGVWTAKGGLYLPYYLRARELASKFSSIRFEWVPREKNEVADGLSKKAYEEYCRSKGREPVYTSGRRKGSATGNQPMTETCTTCRWVRFSGPHVGCFYNGEYRKWLSRKFAYHSKCEDYSPKRF